MSGAVHLQIERARDEEGNHYSRSDEVVSAAGTVKEPPYDKRTPKALEYLHKYDMESAYVAQRGNIETPKSYKMRLYTVKLTSLRAAAGQPEMRGVKMWPNVDWGRVWKNLREAPVSDSTKTEWGRVIHELIPTNKRLQLIKIAQTDICRNCASKDTIENRLIFCGEGKTMWDYTKTLLARMLRTSSTRIPDD
jgi:RNA polymerase subunit RPABC4/transcription elongation factor Spt4